MQRYVLVLALVCLAFVASWQASSRTWLPRIPQPDDVLDAQRARLEVTMKTAGPFVPLPTVATPLGGFCPLAYDPTTGTAVKCDAFSISTSAIYTLERGQWVTWSRER